MCILFKRIKPTFVRVIADFHVCCRRRRCRHNHLERLQYFQWDVVTFSSRLHVNKIRYFKPKHDIFRNPNHVVFVLNQTLNTVFSQLHIVHWNVTFQHIHNMHLRNIDIIAANLTNVIVLQNWTMPKFILVFVLQNLYINCWYLWQDCCYYNTLWIRSLTGPVH